MVSDLDIVRIMQSGLTISKTPYQDAANKLGLTEDQLFNRLYSMMENGSIRRIALVPNHYHIGYRHNAMTVWDISDSKIDEIGEKFGQFEFVSHCYQRPKQHPHWSYNLFAMVHGKSKSEIDEKIDILKKSCAEHCQQFDVLLSKKILKKTGLRLIKDSSKPGEYNA